MEKRRMGRHGLEVPALCLGTMTFGLQVDEQGSREILDKAFEHRLTFLDTADAYPLGGSLDTIGDTEAIIGRWMTDKGNRDQIQLATTWEYNISVGLSYRFGSIFNNVVNSRFGSQRGFGGRGGGGRH